MRCACLALTGFLATALAQIDFAGTRCGAPNPPSVVVKAAASQLAEEEAGRGDTLFQPIQVQTYIHVVTTNVSANDFNQSQLAAQMVYMNNAYNAWNISFVLADSDFTVNNAWANAGYGSAEERQMKQALRRGGYRDLNLYFLSDLGGGLLGFCYFPVDNPTVRQLTLDGCINLAGSLPGGNVNRYNLGGTAAHEAGHWFGLFHVFQGSSCEGRGDYVADTPTQRNATSGCPPYADSCPSKRGLDSIHNYMDYSTDICYNSFTYGQARRAHKMFNRFRK